MAIRPEPAKALSARQECAVVRAAVARNPRSPTLRLRLAKLLNQLDAFDDALAVLTAPEAAPLDGDAELTLVVACLARDGPGDRARALDAATRALALADDDSDRSLAATARARVLMRMGRHAEARAGLEDALRCDPDNPDACRMLIADLLDTDQGETALAVADGLAAQGVAHTQLLATRTLVLARLGRIEEARATVDPGGFRHTELLRPPAGWDDIHAFNAALAEELRTHAGMRYERHGTASQKTWRIDALATGAAPLARTLLTEVAQAVERHVAGLAGRSHPWLAARPANGSLRSWCVITEGDGYERWHTHPFGWMSGVYYVQVPETVARSDDDGGCIAFGIPEEGKGAEASRRFGRKTVRPTEGMLMLFPSHGYHRTFPHGANARRICVSFDIRPA